MTDARLHSKKPIDDEVPFADARELPRDDEPQDDPAIVTPVAADRERVETDPDIDPGEREQVDLDPERQDATD